MQDNENKPLLGVSFMILTGLLFVGVTALVKTLGPSVPAAQAAFLRYALGLVFILPAIKPLLALRPSRSQSGMFIGRGIAHTLAVALWFYAMARIPIADVTAMNYMSPVYITLGAALFLGEPLAMRRLLAVVAALIGALIILRPGFRDIGSGHLAMVGTAMMFGASYLFTKRLTADFSPYLLVAILSVTVAIGLAPLAWSVWVPVTWQQCALLLGVAALATMGHYTMARAFAVAPITVTQPVVFLQLVWAVLLGVFVFDEPMDPYVILGGVVIVAAVTFITLREAALKRSTSASPAQAD